MSNNSKISTHNPTKASNIVHYGVLMVFVLSLLGTITNLEREPVLSFVPLALVITFIGSALYLLLTKHVNLEILKEPLFIGINAFGALILISTIYSKYPLLTVSRSLQFIIVTNGLYLMLNSVKDIKKLFEVVAQIGILFTFIASIYGIVVYHLGSSYSSEGIWVTGIKGFGLEFSQRMSWHRISSFLGNPNLLGVQIMISTLSCLYFLKEYKNKWYVLPILLFLYALLLTGSRASAVGLLMGSAFFLSYSYLKVNLSTRAFLILFIVVGLVIGSYLLINPELLKEFSSLFGRKNSSLLSGRETAWAALIEQIKETPYFGIGYRTSIEAILKESSINVSHSHNLYLSILSEVGVVGFLLFAYIYITPIIKFFLGKGKNQNPSFQLITVCFLVSLLINQFFEDMFAPLSYFFIWLFFILFINYRNQMKMTH